MEPLAYVAQASLILAVLVAAYRLLLRPTTHFGLNRVILWGIVAATFCLPLIELSFVQPQPVRAVVNRTAAVLRTPLKAVIGSKKPNVYLTLPDGKTYSATFNANPLTAFRWPSALFWIYSLVTFALLGQLGWRLVRLRLLIERGIWHTYPGFILVDSPVEAPFSFGRFVVLNLGHHRAAELEQIIQHEWVHVRQNHTLDVLIAELLTAVCWFNPMAYQFRQLVRQNLEYLADQAVLADGTDARTYQLSLLQASMGLYSIPIVNHYSQTGIADRIRMMLRPRSDAWGWLRYWALASVLALLILVMAVREKAVNDADNPLTSTTPIHCPEVAWLQDTYAQHKQEWLERVAFQQQYANRVRWSNIAVVGLKNNHLEILGDYVYNTQIYIDCQPVSAEKLKTIESDYIDELYVYEQAPYSEKPTDKPWVVVLKTRQQLIMPDAARAQFMTYLQAATLTAHPNGYKESFSMNDVLEATFFHRKTVLVERTNTEHLKLYDEFANGTDVIINGIVVAPDEVTTVHVRDIARIQAAERPFTAWFRVDNPLKRFALSIETSPKRSKRDSSYYVFSPFYSGDF